MKIELHSSGTIISIKINNFIIKLKAIYIPNYWQSICFVGIENPHKGEYYEQKFKPSISF